MPAIERRAQDGSPDVGPNTISNPIYIAGISTIIVIVLAVVGWLVRRYYLKRRASKDVGFLSVKGLVPENGQTLSEKDSMHFYATQMGSFSRKDLDDTIPMPEKTLSRPRLGAKATREEIIEFHRQSGEIPHSFSPKPFSFALGVPTSPHDSRRSSKVRQSFLSIRSGGSGSRYSVTSFASSFDPQSNSTTGTVRKVRQLFDAVLPDELLLTKAGEPLTIMQSFDDGWCVVGRENGLMVNTTKSLFKSAPQQESNIELGVVPAWCFIKPMNGVRVERPVRSTSLGITVNMDGPATRSDLISWSNF